MGLKEGRGERKKKRKELEVGFHTLGSPSLHPQQFFLSISSIITTITCPFSSPLLSPPLSPPSFYPLPPPLTFPPYLVHLSCISFLLVDLFLDHRNLPQKFHSQTRKPSWNSDGHRQKSPSLLFFFHSAPDLISIYLPIEFTT